jgi:hypothetical protein
MPTFQELNAIIEQLPPQLKNWREVFRGVNLQIQQPRINEISKNINGYPIARDENYYPTGRKMPRRVRGTKTDISTSIENEGRYQPITGGREAFRTIPFRSAFLSGIQLDAKLYGTAIPMRNARALLGNREWQDAVIKAGYEEEMNTLIDIAESYQKFKTDRDIIEQFGQKLLNKWSQSVLSLRISTIGTQVGSLPAAAEGMDVKYIRPLMPVTRNRIDRMKQHPFFWSRWELNRVNIEVGSIAAQDAGLKFLFGKSPTLEKPLKGLIWGDQQAIGNIHIWAENESLAAGLEAGTPEFEKAVNIRTEFLVRRNQPAWSYLNRSKLGSSTNLFSRSLLIFRTARESQYNVALRAANEYSKSGKNAKAKAQYAKAVGSILSSAAMVALWKNTFRWAVKNGINSILEYFGIWRKDKSAEDLAVDSGIDTIQNVLSLAPGGNVVGGITESAIRAAITGKRYKSFNKGNPFVDMGELGATLALDFGALVYNSMSGAQNEEGEKKWKDDIFRAVDDTLGAIAISTGAPYSGPMQEWIYPFVRESKHSIISNMEVDDIDDPGEFAARIEKFYERRDELKKEVDKILFPGWTNEDLVEQYPTKDSMPQEVYLYFQYDNYGRVINEVGNKIEEYDIYKRRKVYEQISIAIDSLE